ncbi:MULTISPECIES: hypothetical protein [Aquimarina]|uniref:Uncharacterized protein n=1 Tax=Aquimarina rubra TaxID=1920033 RepID=A0ABW5LP66_9FLAO
MEPNTPQIIVQLLLALAYAIPTIFFIVISIYYLVKMGSQTDGILILVGNVIIFLSIIVGRVLFIQLAFYEKWQGEMYSYISGAVNILSFLGASAFAVGVFLLMKKVIKTNTLAK